MHWTARDRQHRTQRGRPPLPTAQAPPGAAAECRGGSSMESEQASVKPARWAPARAAAFQDQSVVDHYHLRPPYPQAVIEILVELAVDTPPTVLDVGTGTGELARRLVAAVQRVDAVDVSPAMIARGRTLPGGDP